MLAAVAVLAKLGLKELAAMVAVVMLGLQGHQQQQTLAAVVVAGIQVTVLVVPELSSCPTPYQKAQPLNSCLLRHGKHQQAFPLLTTWW
jgi:hypothetical protein